MKAKAVHYRKRSIRRRRPYARRHPNAAGNQYFLGRIVDGMLAAVTCFGAVTALLFLILI